MQGGGRRRRCARHAHAWARRSNLRSATAFARAPRPYPASSAPPRAAPRFQDRRPAAISEYLNTLIARYAKKNARKSHARLHRQSAGSQFEANSRAVHSCCFGPPHESWCASSLGLLRPPWRSSSTGPLSSGTSSACSCSGGGCGDRHAARSCAISIGSSQTSARRAAMSMGL